MDLFSSVRSTFLSEPSASRPGLEACIRQFTPTSLPLEQKRKLLNDGPFRVETEPVLAKITLRTATLSFRSEAVAAVFVGVFSMLCCFVFNVVLFSINKTTRNCPKQSMRKQKEKNQTLGKCVSKAEDRKVTPSVVTTDTFIVSSCFCLQSHCARSSNAMQRPTDRFKETDRHSQPARQKDRVHQSDGKSKITLTTVEFTIAETCVSVLVWRVLARCGVGELSLVSLF